MAARYLIGIDLGTTNSALAYVDLKATNKATRSQLRHFAVPQLVAPAEVKPRNLLPSFLYLPGPHDLPPGATALPWDEKATEAVGEFARDYGGKTPGRLVSSAKSWLSHAGVDRSAAFLPWGAPPDVPKISPLAASTLYLMHFVDAWNANHGKSADDQLQKLPVVLTVPASFDDVARTITMEAARQAGLTDVTLLEEPQAAFYCWKHFADENEIRRLQPGMNCLVIDVGGGTTDFSLIAALEQEGELRFIRQAVGDHLLLGGDNMDLALARFIESRLPRRLDASQFATLIQACRRAKESLLGPSPPASMPVTVIGRGSAVVGGTVSVPLSIDDVRQVLFDGFFPNVRIDDRPQRPARGGLHEMGLPYVHDPAITRHLSEFLGRHLSTGVVPEAILFNGGVFQPEALRRHLLDVVRPWYQEVGRGDPMILKTPSLDLAVAYGAAAYAWLKHTGGRVIGGGSARSYYVEVGRDESSSDAMTVLCVVPRHWEENREILLPQHELELTLGEPVVFPLYTSTARDDRAGQILNVAANQLRRLPPLQTVLRGGKRSGGERKTVPVTLAAHTTAIGTLELACVAKDGGTRWRLEFNVRDAIDEDDEESFDEPEAIESASEVLPEAHYQPAVELIRQCFVGDDHRPPSELTKSLEMALDQPRDDWSIALCRRLVETLLDLGESRRRTAAHLARWYHLTGFLLRPGFGAALDRFRVDSLWKLLHAPKADGKSPPEPVGADAWIMWRRVAGGLSTQCQKTLFDRLRPALLSKGKGAFKPGANELAEMWRAAASFERLEPKLKAQLGDELLRQVRQNPAPTFAFWSITRLGARELLHGPLNGILHPDIVSGWIDALMRFEYGHESERLAWLFCLAQLVRRTGQRALDVDDDRRATVLALLDYEEVPAAWRTMVREVTQRSGAERAQLFGDTLPIGLRLRS